MNLGIGLKRFFLCQFLIVYYNNFPLLQTLAKLKKFTESLRHKRTDKQLLPESKLVQTETYHGQILEIDSDNDERDIDDWFVGKLKCRKHIDQQYRFNDSKDNSIMKDDYIVIDPRRN